MVGGVAVREEALGLGIGAKPQIVDEADAGAVQPVEDEAGEVEMLAAAIGLAAFTYLGLERMSYYVNKDAYRGAVRTATQALKTDAAPRGPRRARSAARKKVTA